MALSPRRGLVFWLLLVGVFAGAALIQGLVAHRESRGHLDGLVHELGKAVGETASAAVRTSVAFGSELERALADALLLKSRLLRDRFPSREVPPADLERFARTAGLSRVLLFDEDGALLARARDLPPSGGALDTGLLDRNLETAARKLLGDPGTSRVHELEVPGAGLKPALATATPLRDGSVAVLVQDMQNFARTREASGTGALLRRLERESRIAYARFNAAAPASGPEVVDIESKVALPDGPGTLRIGVDRQPVRQALEVQTRTQMLHGVILVVALALATWGVLRLMASRDALRLRLEREERMGALGRLAAGIAHEVRNPLNAISLAAQRMQRTKDVPPDLTHLAGIVEHEVQRLNRSVDDVLLYARPQQARIARLRAADLLSAVEALGRPEAEAAGVALEISCPEGASLDGDMDLLRGALWNLVRNGIRHAPAGTAVTVGLRVEGAGCVLEVRDRGPGIPADRRREMFQPFQTGTEKGAGLGLALALAAAQAHGGTIQVEEPEDGGARFRIVLPGREPNA